MRNIPKIEKGNTYHIYNRGINGEDIFKEKRNYSHFLNRWQDFIAPVTDTYAYCLLKNHFHFLLRVKNEDVVFVDEVTSKSKILDPTQQFSNFFNSYAQSINKAGNRTGSLFEHPYRRIKVDNEAYFARLVTYIHYNPQKHGFVDDYKQYPYSSYASHLSSKPTKLNRREVIDWFGNENKFVEFHSSYRDFKDLGDLAYEAD
ncbi:MAG TPA: hypothetical protein VK154_06545 [Chitinophagales bacterium]|nr:hypothetical protein [Chitinophagales bacterium]